LDPTEADNPIVLGHGEFGSSGTLASPECKPFFFTFELEEGDPVVFNNNIPVQPAVLPDTGFPPGTWGGLPAQPDENMYHAIGGLRLEIPRLGITTEIVGVPLVDGAWDVAWLGDGAGYLQGTALPTWPGNSVITGHVWDEWNRPGVFARIQELRYGDSIYLHAWGKMYHYQVRENQRVDPSDSAQILDHREYPWLTLLTCEGYNPDGEHYSWRRIVRAVLVNIQEGKR
jgi:LPXTG-site transpeptidase (sortase) family protein